MPDGFGGWVHGGLESRAKQEDRDPLQVSEGSLYAVYNYTVEAKKLETP